jgi:hypothetical protein
MFVDRIGKKNQNVEIEYEMGSRDISIPGMQIDLDNDDQNDHSIAMNED